MYSPLQHNDCIPRIQTPTPFPIQRGNVWIDKINFADARSKLTAIAQDPTFFQGTVQPNLDPFGQQSAEEKKKKKALRQKENIPQAQQSSQ